MIPVFAHTSLIILVLVTMTTFAGTKNGFNLGDSLIPENEILQGGPPRDGIPAINDPVFIEADQATYLKDTDRILGLEIEGQSKAYPISILNWHEVVNDAVNTLNFSVTYCPLCGTGVAFKGTTQSPGIQFGVSGLLYNSDVLLYDLSTQSLWSQLLGKAISGERMGERLVKIPLEHTNWLHWRKNHPDTVVLSDQTGFSRDYSRDPYDGYSTSVTLYFPTSEQAPTDYHPKEWVIGLELDGEYMAFPFAELKRLEKPWIDGKLGTKTYRLDWDKTNQSALVYDAKNNLLPVIQAFWFAWYTFYPQSKIFRAQSG